MQAGCLGFRPESERCKKAFFANSGVLIGLGTIGTGMRLVRRFSRSDARSMENKIKKNSKKTTKTLHNKDCRSVLAQCSRTPIPFPISHCYGEHRAKYQRAISSSWRTAAFSFYVSAVKNTFCVYYFSFLFSFALTWHCIMLRGRGSIKIQGVATAILSEARAWYARWARCVINYTYISF